MQIYLDSKDIINLVEKSEPLFYIEFNKILREGNHKLIVSFTNILEISYPLLNKNIETSVMLLLNRIESLPVKYISSRLIRMELEEATSAHEQNREYKQIEPFVDRLDFSFTYLTISKYYLKYSLAEMVFDLWQAQPGLFRKFRNYTDLFNQQITTARSLIKMLKKREIFKVNISKQLKQNRITIQSERINRFCEWLYTHPEICPAFRINFEVYMKLLQNSKQRIKDQDIPDFIHAQIIPYIDCITLDANKYSYVKQISDELGLRYKDKICKNIEEVIEKINRDK